MELYEEHVPFLTAATRRKRILLECSIQQIAAAERYTTISWQISNPSPFFSTVEIVVKYYIIKSFHLKVCALIQYT